MKKSAVMSMAVGLLVSFHGPSHAGEIKFSELAEKLAKHKEILESAPSKGSIIRMVESRIYDRSYRDYTEQRYSRNDSTCDLRQVATYTMHDNTDSDIYYSYDVVLKNRYLTEDAYCNNYLDKNHQFPSFVRKDSVTIENFLKGFVAGLSDVKIFETGHRGKPVFKISGEGRNGYGDPMHIERIIQTDRSLMANPSIETIKVDSSDRLDFTIRRTYSID